MQFKTFAIILAFIIPQFANADDHYTIQNVPFDADYFPGKNDGKYGVIVLGGSGGGKANDFASKISDMGYHVLSLSYFDRSGKSIVPETLEMIPLEYFEAPKKWLMEKSETKNDGVIVFGLSKGAELALVLASHDNDYKKIIALAPSAVVWSGVPKDFSKIHLASSSWSMNGKPLPFVPYVTKEKQKEIGLDNRHAASMTNEEAVKNARIKVENITYPVLLLSGGKDKSWPATKMANEICSTMNTHTLDCTHVQYRNGDHLLQNEQFSMFKEVKTFLKAQP